MASNDIINNINEEYFVDLGLPSGTMWATRNIDVTQTDGFAVSPYTYDCSYFSWGNTDGHNLNTGGTFDYDFGGVNSSSPYYEGQPYGSTSGSTFPGGKDVNLPLLFDAARQNLGTPWRIPNVTEYNELAANVDYCDEEGNVVTAATVVTIDDVSGYMFKSKINGNTIFFPLTGWGKKAKRSNVDCVCAWLSTSNTNTTPTQEQFERSARLIVLSQTYLLGSNYIINRYSGLTIRPIFSFNQFDRDYIKSFDSLSKYNDFKESEDYVEPNVSYIDVDGGDDVIKYNKDYSKDYLTFVTLEDGNFTLTIGSAVTTAMVESVSYSLDNGDTWITTNNVNDETITITTPTIKKGKKVMWKGDAVQMSTQYSGTITDEELGATYVSRFGSSGKFNVQGNIMSLLYGDDFASADGFESGSTRNFMHLFGYINASDKANVVSAKNLILKNTNIKSYQRLFSNCNLLVEPPTLPNKALAEDACYYYMFTNCVNLMYAPSLPATSVGASGYGYTFQNCTSLTTPPQLPAKTLGDACYMNMFSGCKSLTTAPDLPAAEVGASAYTAMFNGCTSLITPPSMSATTTIGARGCYGMFSGCTSMTSVPNLPATTLGSACYFYMFKGCTSLTTVPQDLLPAETLPSSAYTAMFQNCTSLTVAPNLSATTIATHCYRSMFNNCTSLTTAQSTLPSTTTKTGCYRTMFAVCPSLVKAPDLPAETVGTSAYTGMFSGCTSLNEVKCLATNISATGCTSNWMKGVSSSGTFTKSASMTSWTTGVSGIPNGWTVVDAS